jgi:predicted RNA polymerase sigma factor
MPSLSIFEVELEAANGDHRICIEKDDELYRLIFYSCSPTLIAVSKDSNTIFAELRKFLTGWPSTF